LLIKHRDEFAKSGEAQALLDLDRSVASGRSMSQIGTGKGKPPTPFMLADDTMQADGMNTCERRSRWLMQSESSPHPNSAASNTAAGMPTN
jgi:hypothetical protein